MRLVPKSAHYKMMRLSSLLLALGLGLLSSQAQWLDEETLRFERGQLYREDRNPFEWQGSFDLSNVDTGRAAPEILRWGSQRNVAGDHSGGMFSERLSLGGSSRNSSNFSPRLMPFGGPLLYAQGRSLDISFERPDPLDFAEADIIDYYQYAIPYQEGSGVAEVSYGEFGSLTASMETNIPMETLDINVRVSTKEFGDYRDGDDMLLTDSLDKNNPKVAYTDQAKNRDIYRIREFETSGKYVFSENQYLEFNGQYSDAQGVYFPELRLDAEYDRGSNVSATYHIQNPSSSLQSLSFRAFSSNAQQELNDKLRETKITNLENPLPEDYSTRSNSRSFTQGFDFKAIKDFSDGKISFGMLRYWQEWEAISETLGDRSEMLPLINQSNFAAYLEGQRFLGRTTISAAMRIDQLDTEVDGNLGLLKKYRNVGQRQIQDSALSASLQFQYDLTDEIRLYSEVSHSVRAPDPNEMYIQYEYQRAPGNQLLWLGNPDLESVKNTSFDAGVEIQFEKFKLRMNGFLSRVQDLIYLENIGPALEENGFSTLGTAYSYENIDAEIYGGDASLEFRLNDRMKLVGSIEFLKGTKTQLDGFSADEDLGEMPPVRGRIALEYDNDLWFGKVEWRGAEALTNVDESISEAPLDGYSVVNLLIGYYVAENLLVTVGVENLSDQSYSTRNVNIRNPFSNYGVSNEPGRFVYLSLKWGF